MSPPGWVAAPVSLHAWSGSHSVRRRSGDDSADTEKHQDKSFSALKYLKYNVLWKWGLKVVVLENMQSMVVHRER
jgi:hypothetical protein